MRRIEEAKRLVSDIGVVLMRKYPVMYFLLNMLRIEYVGEKAVAATDGDRLYVGDDLLERSGKERLFIVMHELLHVMLNHVKRAKVAGYPRDIYNVAADYIVNNTLRSVYDLEVPRDAIVDIPGVAGFEYSKYSTEEVAEMLIKEAKENHEIKGGFPNDLRAVEGGEEIKDAEKSAQGLSPQEKVQRALVKALAVGSEKLNAFEREVYLNLVNSQIAWREYLKNVLSAKLSEVQATYRRPNRRFAGLPGTKKLGKPDVVALIDVSGSITQSEMRQFISELAEIGKRAGKTVVVFWDVGIVDVQTVSTRSDVKKIKIPVGGGTDFIETLREVKKKGLIRPHDVVVVLSDWCFSIDDDVRRFCKQKNVVCVSTEGNDANGVKTLPLKVKQEV